ncbi:SMC-Scp complex subunit ScpB [Tumebacillus algifaecis]|uniref:Segregation and condensation protein B n=1 Tax=Tumebacillus algifaecis TaxID=1214604 RepID=A0A223D129_9BACL|nr:SMC-Scp complex subunit ScpB [Tumebacillus algifaecis]ASS75067.1 SMC-Scp complex subunit ScpB [Tumebacillus algifaecis]
MDAKEIKSVIEGLLFVSGSDGIEAKQLADILELDREEARDYLYDLQTDFIREGRGIRIVEVAGMFQLTTRPEHAIFFERLAHQPQQATLSQAAIETLAIIAYKQPITRSGIEDVRGVKSERAVNTLLSKQLIKEVGRAEGPGRPILFGTTREFLEYFGLRDLKELPPPPALVPMNDLQDEEEHLLFQMPDMFPEAGDE